MRHPEEPPPPGSMAEAWERFDVAKRMLRSEVRSAVEDAAIAIVEWLRERPGVVALLVIAVPVFLIVVYLSEGWQGLLYVVTLWVLAWRLGKGLRRQ